MALPRPRVSPFICQSCRQRFLSPTRRVFSSTPFRAADDTAVSSGREGASGGLSNLSREIRQPAARRGSSTPRTDAFDADHNPFSEILDATPESLITEQFGRNLDMSREMQKAHRLHVFAHKHNTHITLVQPPRSAAETTSSRIAGAKVSTAEQKKVVDTLLSLSTGNIGFRKAGRGTYDAAFQLAAFTFKQMQDKGMSRDMNKLEVVLRGFGAGRQAVTKALLGTEGRHIRGKISAVVDATRLKQGGPRGKKPRRLG